MNQNNFFELKNEIRFIPGRITEVEKPKKFTMNGDKVFYHNTDLKKYPMIKIATLTDEEIKECESKGYKVPIMRNIKCQLFLNVCESEIYLMYGKLKGYSLPSIIRYRRFLVEMNRGEAPTPVQRSVIFEW